MDHLRKNWLRYVAAISVIGVGLRYGPEAQQMLVDLLAEIGLAPAVQ